MKKKFINGFTSWQESHFEIVQGITTALNSEDKNKAVEVSEQQGTGGLYELAEQLTNNFEALHAGRVWDGEFFDEMENFINQNLYATVNV